MNPFQSLPEYERFVYTLQQRHPSIRCSTLTVTDPHHKHIPPDIKHHRIPAPELSFTRPNLPVLIEEVKRLLKD